MRHVKANHKTWTTILILLLVFALSSFTLAGCSSGGADTESATHETAEGGKAEKAEGHGEEATEEHAEEPAPEEVTDPAVLYTNNCGACHGHDGSGVVGPSIRATSLSIGQIETKINSGGASMPKFKGGELTEEQIKIITKYVKEELK